MVELAMSKGVNYYDTAWGYHGGHSETVLGEALRRYPRDTFYLADKFPGYDLGNMPKVREIFEAQLKKCGVEYFDFYLFHNVCELNIDAYLDPKYGIHDYLTEQKRSGRIRHLGFSCHGQLNVLRRFLEAYGRDMEFCQLQLNWLDWEFQDAKNKVELLGEYGIPVWVMEPLRGGALAHLTPERETALLALRPGETVPGWAFRFLQTLPTVTVTLSGMSDLAQLKANLRTYETEAPLNAAELETLTGFAAEMARQKTLPCTGCRYCIGHCPQELDIPYMMTLYNEHVLTGGGFIAPMALMAVDRDHWPDACLHCGSCEQVCPQQLHISDMMEDFAGMMAKGAEL